MERRDFLKGLAAASGALSAPALYGAQANRPAPQLLAQDNAQSRPPDDPWPGKKRILAIADPQEWYASPGYHHDAASHTLATVERLGRESGAWVTVIRTDMHLLTKQPIAGYNVRNLNNFDAVFYMGEGPWNITDQQKADLLSFVHEDGKGFPKEFTFRDQYTIVGPNYSREIDHVIMRMNPKAFPEVFASLQPDPSSTHHPSSEQLQANLKKLADLRTDGDYPIVWCKKYGKGRVWYSTFGHLEATLDDARIQQMYIGAIKWALGLTDADITPHPFPGNP